MEEKNIAAEMVESKFKIGDKVKVVKYGHLMFKSKKNYQEESDFYAKYRVKLENDILRMLFGKDVPQESVEGVKGKSEPDNIYLETEDMWWIDTSPELVGQEGVVCKVALTQGRFQYAVDEIKGKHAWYDENQLELIK